MGVEVDEWTAEGRGREQRVGDGAVNPVITSAFRLSEQLAAKADPALIADDEEQFGVIAESLEHSMAELSDRLGAARLAPGGTGRAALDRDQEIHRLTAQLRLLRRFGLDLCLAAWSARTIPIRCMSAGRA